MEARREEEEEEEMEEEVVEEEEDVERGKQSGQAARTVRAVTSLASCLLC